MSNLSYDVFVSESPPQSGVLPNGEPKTFSPVASTLIYGSESAVLTDPAFAADQARALGDWVARKGRKLTDIFITHGHGDHWFAAGLLAERFGARVVATAGTIAQMHGNLAARPFLWDKMFPGMIPPSPVTAVTVPANHFTLEGHDLVMVEVGHTDSADTSVLHIPDLGLVVAGHQNKQLGADADRLIAETRQYLDDANQFLETEKTAVDFFNAKLKRYPNHLGRTVLWVGASIIYGVREHPGEDVGAITVNAWL